MSVNALPPSQICGMMENRSAATIVHYGTTTKTNNGSDEHIGVVKTLDVLQPDELDEVRSARFSYVHQVSIPRLQWHKQHQPEQAQSRKNDHDKQSSHPTKIVSPWTDDDDDDRHGDPLSKHVDPPGEEDLHPQCNCEV